MDRKLKIGAGIAGGALAAATVIALALPATGSTIAADDTPTPSTTTAPKLGDGLDPDGERGGRGGGPGAGETALTGTDAERATAAAQEAVEGGTVLRVETDNGGVYEAHVRKSDGTEVVVKMDKDFAVTGVEEFTGVRGGHGGGPGGPGETPEPGTSEDATASTTSFASA